MSEPASALLEQAEALDRSDALASLRQEFCFPCGADGNEYLYFCGNSLGLLPKRAAALVREELDDWSRLAVDGHFAARRPWFSYHEQFREPLARLVGAQPDEVVAMNSLTVNLHLMMVSFYRPTPQRRKILIEAAAFPSDLYAVQSQIAFHGGDPDRDLICVSPAPGTEQIDESQIEQTLEREGEQIALMLLGAVHYYTGQRFDIARLTRAAHRAGVVAGWDLAHAIGNVPLTLHDDQVDFAVWCSYKYLNSGPGAVAGCFVHRRHGASDSLPRFAGWWGNDPATRFQMDQQRRFVPRKGADGWQVSNPPVLSLTPLLASLELFERATLPRLRAKSLRLTGWLYDALAQASPRIGTILTPSEPERRGAQLSLRVPGQAADWQARLHQLGAIVDLRRPDVLRIAPTPSYNSFRDLARLVGLLETLGQQR
jgi:kynureninase